MVQRGSGTEMSPLVAIPPPNICKNRYPSIKIKLFRFQESRQLSRAETLLVLALRRRQWQRLLSPISHQRLHTRRFPSTGALRPAALLHPSRRDMQENSSLSFSLPLLLWACRGCAMSKWGARSSSEALAPGVSTQLWAVWGLPV